ncbi:MAG: ATP-binding cassette subfamily B multidrug efflux pump [Candidatus Paceibacteria bacterium]|jgi:ATP-binding cassette subfamily B multidrug efflux pump
MSDLDPEDAELIATAKWDGSVLLRLLGWAAPHKRDFLFSFLVLGALFAVQLVAPYVWRLALDGPVRGALEEGLDLGTARSQLGTLTAIYAGLLLVQGGLSYFEVAQLARTGQRVIHDLRTDLFAHIQSLDLAFFDERPTGSLVTRVTSDVENLNELFTSGLLVLLFDVIKIVVILGVLFWIRVDLALVVVAVTPVLILISMLFRGGARRGYREVRAHLSRLNGYLQEVLSGVSVVQLFQREEQVSSEFGSRLQPYLDANLRTLKLFALFFPAISLTVFVAQAAILRVGGGEILAGTLELGVFFQFWFYLALLVSPVRELGERYNILQAAFASAERVFDILDTEASIGAPQGPALGEVEPGTPLVQFEDVSFSYVQDTQVLRGVDLHVAPGEVVAIVGATGAGKSTIVNLLLRFHDPSAGLVRFDGFPLQQWDPRALRQQCGLVLQDGFLFEGTVRENLVMGRSEITEESLQQALEMSCASDLIERLPHGLKTTLSERGSELSTGERQLLAMARALAGEPRLVILDEATASVDSGTEARVEQATRNLLTNRSALVVAHRLSTVRRADRILLIHGGRIVESGSHDELLARNGRYARLHELQFNGEAPPSSPSS